MATKADFGLSGLLVPESDLLVGGAAPNVADGSAGVDAPQQELAVVVEAAQRHVAVGQTVKVLHSREQGLRILLFPLVKPSPAQLCSLPKEKPSTSFSRARIVPCRSDVLQQATLIVMGACRRFLNATSRSIFLTTSSNFRGTLICSNSSRVAPSKLILISSSPDSIKRRALASLNRDPLEKIFTLRTRLFFA